MSTAVADMPLSRESCAEHLRDALQILGSKPMDELDELDLAAVLHRLNQALEQADEERASYRAAVELLRESEAARARLEGQLRDEQELWGGLESLGVHVFVDWHRRHYTVERRYSRTILITESWSDAVKVQNELRALERNLNHQPARKRAVGD